MTEKQQAIVLDDIFTYKLSFNMEINVSLNYAVASIQASTITVNAGPCVLRFGYVAVLAGVCERSRQSLLFIPGAARAQATSTSEHTRPSQYMYTYTDFDRPHIRSAPK